MITMKNLKKDFDKGRVHAVADVSFEIADNEIFALLGPNGAGKTTTMRMLSTLLAPTAGEIEYDGMPAKGNEQAVQTAGLDARGGDEFVDEALLAADRGDYALLLLAKRRGIRRSLHRRLCLKVELAVGGTRRR